MTKTSTAALPPKSPANRATKTEVIATTKIQKIARGKADRQRLICTRELFDKTDKNPDGKITKISFIKTLDIHDGDLNVCKQLGLPESKLGGKNGVALFKQALDEKFEDSADKDAVLTMSDFLDFLHQYKAGAAAEHKIQEASAVKIQATTRGKQGRVTAQAKKKAGLPPPTKVKVADEEEEKEENEEYEEKEEDPLEKGSKPALEDDKPVESSKSTATVIAGNSGAPLATMPESKKSSLNSGRKSPSSVADPAVA